MALDQIIGWGQVLKGLLSFIAPQIGLRTFARVSPERAGEFVIGGVFLLALCALLWYIVLTR